MFDSTPILSLLVDGWNKNKMPIPSTSICPFIMSMWYRLHTFSTFAGASKCVCFAASSHCCWFEKLKLTSSLGIPMLPCTLEISNCQTVWCLWPVPHARICEALISNHRTRRDGKTMTRTMRQTEACSSFVRIQHGCSRSEALFPSSCGQCSR